MYDGICGYEPPQIGIGLSEEQKKEQTKLLTSIHEKTKWKWFVNINAIVLMTIGIFLWGYYEWRNIVHETIFDELV